MVFGIGDNCRQSKRLEQALISYIRQKNYRLNSIAYFDFSGCEIHFLISRKIAAWQHRHFPHGENAFSDGNISHARHVQRPRHNRPPHQVEQGRQALRHDG
ncbi:MAG: hypothetical protein LBE51_18670 [Acidovorax sp.]|nr:hypothetical protein [Acidovorax sp.]